MAVEKDWAILITKPNIKLSYMVDRGIFRCADEMIEPKFFLLEWTYPLTQSLNDWFWSVIHKLNLIASIRLFHQIYLKLLKTIYQITLKMIQASYRK